MSNVIIAGSANHDIVAVAPRHPERGETVTGSSLQTFVGGKGVNQAIAAARLGAHVVLAAAIGNDAAAGEIESFLAREPIDVSHVRRDPELHTGTALIVVADGNNAMVVLPGANMRTSVADIDALPMGAGDICLTQLEIPEESVRRFLSRARMAGATAILNAAPVKHVEPSTLALADILIVNQEECSVFASGHPARLRTREEQVVVETLGREGVYAISRDGEVTLPAHDVQVRDATGAGDAFCGALAASLAAGASLPEALRRGNAAAALCVQQMGASSMPTRAELDAFLTER